MKTRLILSVVAAVVLFLWGFASWMALPWHKAVVNQFTNETAVAQVLKENSPQQGVYYLPYSPEKHAPDQVGAFINVLPNGAPMNMGIHLLVDFVSQIISAFLLLTLLGKQENMSYGCKVGFFSLAGLLIGFASHMLYWNWFSFSTPYIAVAIADVWIGWTLAGLVLAKLIKS